MDTIFAVSSGVGRSAIAVVRISGPACLAAVNALVQRTLKPRQATLVRLHDPVSGEVLDQSIALVFPAPASFTGEDCAELHVHGGRAVVKSVLQALASCPGLKAAEPGEFTRRAFQNGKLDLDSAEGLADLIEADTILQQRQALSALNGSLDKGVTRWREQILNAQAMLEAWLDFPDEDDVSDGLIAECQELLGHLRVDLEDSIEASTRSEIIREGVTVLIAGPPNVGKSSLLNCISRREAAIVADVPGTTRDLIEVRLDIAGVPLVIVDGAGIRDTEDRVETIGIERVKDVATRAQIAIWLSSSENDPIDVPDWLLSSGCRVLNVRSKIDIARVPPEGHGLSALTGQGVPELLNDLVLHANSLLKLEESRPLLRQRHVSVIQNVFDAVTEGLRHLEAARVELAVEECRRATKWLAQVTKSVQSEDVLDSVFHRFCIGK